MISKLVSRLTKTSLGHTVWRRIASLIPLAERADHIFLTSLFALSLASSAFAADKLEYNRDIRPILAENCFACHGPDSAARKADLRLDRREMAMQTTAIVPGKPDESEL